MTSRELAKLLGITHGAISQWENGGGIAPANLAAAARELDLNLPALLAAGPHPAELVDKPDEMAVLAAYRLLADDWQERAIDMLLRLSGPPRRNSTNIPSRDKPNDVV